MASPWSPRWPRSRRHRERPSAFDRRGRNEGRAAGTARDALYDRILDRLSGIGDIWLAAESKDYDTADRLGREYSDELRLVLDDLGWGDRFPDSEPIELKTPPDVLRRVFCRLRDSTATERAAEATRWAESEKLEQCNRLVGEACDNVLRTLGDPA